MAMIGKIQRVNPREVWKHEALDFTTWFEENIDVLNDALDLKIVNADREQTAGDFSVDEAGSGSSPSHAGYRIWWTRHMVVAEIVKAPADTLRFVEWYTAYAPWRSKERVEAYERTRKRPPEGVESIPHSTEDVTVDEAVSQDVSEIFGTWHRASRAVSIGRKRPTKGAEKNQLRKVRYHMEGEETQP